MGEASKKLIGWTDRVTGTVHRGWVHYEFGTSVDGAPGNCRACVDHHKKRAEQNRQSDRQQRLNAAKAGRPVPAKQEFTGQTPCHRCPKWNLYPDRFGLHPNNDNIVRCFQRAAQVEHRVGTMAGAFLLGTLTLRDAILAVEYFGQDFPTRLHRQNAVDLILAMARIATETRQANEEKERKRQENEAKSKRAK